MEIAVLGGGNGAFAAAADLAEQGHQVRLWRRNKDAATALADARSQLTLLDHTGERQVQLALVTSDIRQAVNDAPLIVFPGPAHAQNDVAHALAPDLIDGQTVYLPPGTFGSYLMAKIVRDAGNSADVSFAETGTLPYLARKRDESTVAITRRATRLPTGVFPARNSEQAREIIGAAFPAIEPCEDALSGALMNAGPIIHPPLIMMNAGPIEHFEHRNEHWDIHNEGTQPAIRRVTTALDGERIRIREKLGYGAPHFPLADHYATDGDEWMYGRAAHDKLVDSGDWREALILTSHRYMREDVALGLAFLVSCGKFSGVPTPVACGLLALGSAICDEDFFNGPRTFANLGLAHHCMASLQRLLERGL
jgi:opine dehydrogenase